MATQIFTRSTPAAVTLVTTPADRLIAQLITQLTANAANATFKMKIIASSNTSPRYLLVGRKDNSAGRWIIFGQNGSTPNAAATVDAPTASALYIGYSPTSTLSAPSTSYLTGVSLSDSDYSKGVAVMANTMIANADARIQYFDSADTFSIAVSSLTASGCIFSTAGKIWKDWTGTDQHGVCGTGTAGVISSSWSSNVSNPIPTGQLTSTGGMLTDGNQGITLLLISGTWVPVARGTIHSNTNVPIVLEDPATNIAQFHPIILAAPIDQLSLGLVGKLNQICYGPQCLRETNYTAAVGGAHIAYGVSWSNTVPSAGLWLVDADV